MPVAPGCRHLGGGGATASRAAAPKDSRLRARSGMGTFFTGISLRCRDGRVWGRSASVLPEGAALAAARGPWSGRTLATRRARADRGSHRPAARLRGLQLPQLRPPGARTWPQQLPWRARPAAPARAPRHAWRPRRWWRRPSPPARAAASTSRATSSSQFAPRARQVAAAARTAWPGSGGRPGPAGHPSGACCGRDAAALQPGAFEFQVLQHAAAHERLARACGRPSAVMSHPSSSAPGASPGAAGSAPGSRCSRASPAAATRAARRLQPTHVLHGRRRRCGRSAPRPAW
jgi:hypothetical protein